MRKKVLLLHVPHRTRKIYIHSYYCSFSSKAYYYWSPDDLILISGLLKDFEVRVIDAIAERLSFPECEEKILDFSPEVIIFTTGTATWDNDLPFLKRIKSKIDCLLLGTSAIFMFEPAYFLENFPFLDGLIIDITSPRIAEFIRGKRESNGAIAFRSADGSLYLPPPEPKEKVFTLPVPLHHLFPFRLNLSPLARRKPFALVVTSIGCPNSCRFCVVGSVKYRYRPVENIIEELQYLHQLGIKEIMFNDPTFTASRKRTIELCRKMKERNFNFTWVANAHVATLNEEVLKHMRASGGHTLMIGVESANQEILDRYAKGISVEKTKQAFRLCQQYGFRTLAYFIIGLPGETRESILETIRLARELDCDFASFSIATPDIGTAMREEAIKQGLISPETRIFDSTGFPVFTGGNLSKEEIWRLRQKAIRSFYLRPGYIFKRLTRMRSWQELRVHLEQAQAMFFS
jgi:radical SAM superfamily enzyme YgiQ (UPF0313 family)